MGDETCFDCCTAGYIQDRALGGSAKRDMPISNNTKALTLFTTKYRHVTSIRLGSLGACVLPVQGKLAQGQ